MMLLTALAWAEEAAVQPAPLSPVGATIMVTSVAFVTVLTLACYRRILAPQA